MSAEECNAHMLDYNLWEREQNNLRNDKKKNKKSEQRDYKVTK